MSYTTTLAGFASFLATDAADMRVRAPSIIDLSRRANILPSPVTALMVVRAFCDSPAAWGAGNDTLATMLASTLGSILGTGVTPSTIQPALATLLAQSTAESQAAYDAAVANFGTVAAAQMRQDFATAFSQLRNT